MTRTSTSERRLAISVQYIVTLEQKLAASKRQVTLLLSAQNNPQLYLRVAEVGEHRVKRDALRDQFAKERNTRAVRPSDSAVEPDWDKLEEAFA